MNIKISEKVSKNKVQSVKIIKNDEKSNIEETRKINYIDEYNEFSIFDKNLDTSIIDQKIPCYSNSNVSSSFF